MNRPFLLVAALLLGVFTAQPVRATLTPFSAEYSVRYQGIPASAQTSLQRQGGNWLYLMTVGNAAASMNQATVFMKRGDFYVPLGAWAAEDFQGAYDSRRGQLQVAGRR